LWDLRSFDGISDDLNQTKYPTPIGNSKASLNSSKASSSITASSIYDTNDEHHISFSKNGKEIVDFDAEFPDVSKPATTDFLTVPNLFSDHLFDMYGFGSDGFSDEGGTVKTRRSNSLTTPTASADFATSSSAENLANLQKPRSFSLSMESSRNGLVSSGSDTRLDKMSHMRFNNSTHHIGMGHIGVWLKSLRLHKYFWLFSNMSYEQMMEMTEEYLESLGVTKGARHKLVLCIQKLSERVPLLKQIEKELIDGSRPLKNGLDELTNIILTPMKPINSVPNDDDVATHVLRVLDCGEFFFR
jgi:PHAT/SAM domain (Sterile alpha motif)